jgi:hypothetical protein
VVALRGDADEFQAIAMRGNHAQGAFTDGTGGAEEDDATFGRRWHRVEGTLCPDNRGGFQHERGEVFGIYWG